jgi:hypothetical protein
MAITVVCRLRRPTTAVFPRDLRPKRKTQPKVRNARNVGIDDEDGFIPNLKREDNMTDNIDRGPFMKMLDRQALALQAKTGESYASAFTKCYTAPENKSIVDNARLDHLAQRCNVWLAVLRDPGRQGRADGCGAR